MLLKLINQSMCVFYFATKVKKMDEDEGKHEDQPDYSGAAGELAQLVQQQIQGSKDSMQPIVGHHDMTSEISYPFGNLTSPKRTPVNLEPDQQMLNPDLSISSESFGAISNLYPFLLEHTDVYLRGLGYAFCNLCHGKVSWSSMESLIEHLESVKHSRIQLKIESRIHEFSWLELLQGVPSCIPCNKEVPWKSLIKLKEHEESSDHQSRAIFYENNCKDEVKMETDEPAVSLDKITIQKMDIGKSLTEELIKLRAKTESTLSLVCADKIVFAHVEPFLLSTLLFTSQEELNFQSPILCPGFNSEDVQLALGKNSILQILSNTYFFLIFILALEMICPIFIDSRFRTEIMLFVSFRACKVN